MKIRLLYLSLFLLTSLSSKAQFHEVGIMTGVTNYLGDLVPPQEYFLGTKFSIGATYQYNITDRLSVRGNVFWGQLSGSDRNSSYDSGRRQRNLDFHTNLMEVSALAQFNILPFHPKRKFKPVTPFIFLGIGMFHFNPSTIYKGERVYLQPLGTEGQGMEGYDKKYDLVGLCIPAGIGVKFHLHKRIHLSIEIGLRKTFTDYLDDASGDYVKLDELRAGNGILAANVSNRTYDEDGNQIEQFGNPRGHAGKDWYSFMGISLTYSLHKGYYFKAKKKKPKTKVTKPKKKDNGKWM